jgi:signal transduction histidine kinase
VYLAATYAFSASVAAAMVTAGESAALWQVATAGTLAAVCIGLVLFVRRIRRAGRRERRILRVPIAGICLAIVTFGLWQLKTGLHLTGAGRWTVPLVELAQIAGVAGVPSACLFGVLRRRWDQARIAQLVRDLAHTPAGQLQPALARALDDPELVLAFPADDGFATADGHPFPLPGPASERTVTTVGSTGVPQAVIVHDRSVDDPTLTEAVRHAVHLALDNARLQTELRAQLAEVRASRMRLVEAGDAARKRIERDLHDGAQQRLLSAGMMLHLLRDRLADPDEETADLLRQLSDEVRAALAELRELARGIHPAALTAQGLPSALENLAGRACLPVRLVIPAGLPRLPGRVEATAYFAVSEALTNVTKHAGAGQAEVSASLDGARLVVRVTDDGRGGAVMGPGLAGLADRVAAVGGRIGLSSPAGDGTTVEVVLPCD